LGQEGDSPLADAAAENTYAKLIADRGFVHIKNVSQAAAGKTHAVRVAYEVLGI
jgi:hypothetical protein